MRNLSQWLEYIETAHTQSIDMGLARVRKVFNRLFLDFSDTCIVTVAGTNGKGTSCRFIEQGCIDAGYKVGVYSSPHIERFNERVRLNGEDVSDNTLTKAFERVHEASHGHSDPISLSYFEYATLCGLIIFAEAKLDVCLLEVGLGGRLDATNIVDAHIGVITSIGLDHQSYLGNTTELIAAEKAGIIKATQQVVIGYENIHESVQKILQQNHNPVLVSGKNFGIDEKKSAGWITINQDVYQFDISKTKIPPQNVMTALASMYFISEHVNSEHTLLLPLDRLQTLVSKVAMPGRLQILSDSPLIVLDVAHNEDSAKYLVKRVQQIPHQRCHIVIGMLKDKNIEATINCLAKLDAKWYCTDLPTDRGEKAPRLISAVSPHQQDSQAFNSCKSALQQAVHNYATNDMILIVGSFVLASQCMAALKDLGLDSIQ